MSKEPFRPKAYVKEGCPFSFKFLVFMSEAGLLDQIEIHTLRESDPDFEATKERLSAGLGKAATFPTVQLAPDRYMADSDRLIEHFAEQNGVRPDDLPVLSLYKRGIFPKLIELHRLKTAART